MIFLCCLCFLLFFLEHAPHAVGSSAILLLHGSEPSRVSLIDLNRQ